MKKIIIIFAILLSACSTIETSTESNLETTTKPATETKVIEVLVPPEKLQQFLEQGYQQLTFGNTKKAIAEFDKTIAACQELYADQGNKVYTSRYMPETLYYMFAATAEKQPSVVVDSVCSDGLYLKGYASLDLGKIAEAEQLIVQALAMAPMNSMYLSELGHIYQTQENWSKAHELFTRAEEAAETYSPPHVRDQELARAKRGVGYNLIELGQLDAAEKKFNECLAINSEDPGALMELEYIEHLREKSNNL